MASLNQNRSEGGAATASAARLSAALVLLLALSAGAASALAPASRKPAAKKKPAAAAYRPGPPAAQASAAKRTVAVDFNRDVRPILARNCFKCHGPDEGQRMAGLRLDVRASAVAESASGRRAIVPGHPEKSALVERIFHANGGLRMPPAHSNKKLTETEKQTLRAWVSAGAPYAPHWAFTPLPKTAIPAVKQQSWVRNPIDRFILARLEAAGLKPAPQADPATLVRRAYIDLIGMPPTPEEADEFLRDLAPGAWERLIDRLLASPHYGERWARRWLDLARYADTNGYEKDRPRTIWPYRDWVIRALNSDMPFDQFTVEQLAGDLLPNPTREQRIATGFHRNTMLNEEGGIDPLEYRFHAMTDRVATTGVTWLGLTLGCAQCHTHKFDPVTHKEYFGFMALLDNADEPELELPDPAVDERRTKLKAEIADLEQGLAEKYPGGAEPLASAEAAWLDEQRGRLTTWRALTPLSASSEVPHLEILPDGSVLASGDMTKSDQYRLELTGLRGATAIRIDAIPDLRLPRGGPGRIAYEGPIGDFFLSEVTLISAGEKRELREVSADFAASNGAAAGAIDGNPQSGWAINGAQALPHYLVVNLEKPLEEDKATLTLLFEKYYAAGLGRLRLSAATAEGKVKALTIGPDLEPELAVAPETRTAEQTAALRRAFLLASPELAPAREPLEKLRKSLPEPVRTLVLQERPPENPRVTLHRHRGEYLQPRDPVALGVPSVLPGLPAGRPANRLTLARWLVSRQNPLTARVTVNRAWSDFFGEGLVRSLGDFGYQGESPSHPELLDWLASRFVDDGWSMKRLHRLIVTSATYRQSSSYRRDLQQADPENRLLARGPRRRLEGEMLRDAALKAAGLLSPKIGGPSVFPPQPAGVTSEGTYGPLEWKVSEGEDRYRRGLYTFAKRTAPYAQFATFDGPSGESCIVQREVSNTPLQALTLLNDAVFVEAADALGRLIAGRPGSDLDKAAYLFRRILTREPASGEAASLLSFFQTQQGRLSAGKTATGSDAPAGPAERAWSAAARVLLNLDEAIVRR